MPRNDTTSGLIGCRRCGAENFAFASFCIVCGCALGGVEDEPGLDGGGQGATRLVESNDPQGRPGWLSPGRLRSWEAAAGIALLLLVVGYALFNWQQSTVRSNAYEAGQTAEQRRDWDRAVESFRQAGDLKDAPRRMQAAQQQVDERDRLYNQAKAAESRRDWAGEIQALNQLQAIQPAYRDSDQRLSQAKEQSLSGALGRLVYLVDRGPKAGLYIRGGDGQVTRLPGSDGRSVVRAVAPGGSALVYDRPAQPSERCVDPASIRHPSGKIIPGSQGPGRVPVLVRLDRAQSVSEQPLRCLNSNGSGIFTGSGLWWFDAGYGSPGAGRDAYYQSDSSSLPAARISDADAGKRVLALDPARSRVMLVQAERVSSLGSWQSQLYLSGADGQGAQWLDTVPGQVMQASMSEDGRWLVFVAQLNTARTEQAVLALRLTGSPAATRRRFASTWPRNALQLGNSLQTSDLNAIFIPSEDGHSKVAITHAEGGHESLEIYDLDRGTALYNWEASAASELTWSLAGLSPDGDLLALRAQGRQEATIAVLELKPNGGLDSSAVQVAAYPGGRVHVQFGQGGSLVLMQVAGDPNGRQASTSLYLCRTGEQGTLSTPNLLARALSPRLAGASSFALAQDGSLLAYVTPSGDLRAMFLDGAADFLIAQGAASVWGLKQPQDMSAIGQSMEQSP